MASPPRRSELCERHHQLAYIANERQPERQRHVPGPAPATLTGGDPAGRLDTGCVAAHGTFACDDKGHCTFTQNAKPATAFLFDLIARLQAMATVPMIDIQAYARWLDQ